MSAFSISDFLDQVQAENLRIDYNELLTREWKKLGEGAQGTVHKASLFGTDVAVKVSLASTINAGNSANIVQEIKMLKELRHPKIVELMGVSTDLNMNICIVTEYLGGGSLFHVLHTPSRSLTWRDNLLQYAIDICEGMAYMHAQRPIALHRDLKSPNILITDNGTTAKIADFGFARLYAETMSTKGTPRWMAPEILSGSGSYTEKVDVYSFGIVLWEMCTRAIPYQNESGQELTTKIVNDNLRPQFPDDGSLPEILEDLYEDCVSSNVDERPAFSYILAKLKAKVKKAVDSDNGPYPIVHPTNCSCLGYAGPLSALYQ